MPHTETATTKVTATRGRDRAWSRPIATVGFLGAFVALLLLPPVAATFFAMDDPSTGNRVALAIGAVGVLAISIVLIAYRRRLPPGPALVFFSVLCLIGVELTARAAVVAFFPHARLSLARLAARTYPEKMAYRGHPFLQFTGTPSVAVVEGRRIGDLTPFNNFGFPGRDVVYGKTPGVIRVAALGGSTTADGYPAVMEDLLNETLAASGRRAEVFNFGLGSYTSAHTLANFVLNVVDFEPDYVVVHEGWNDSVARDLEGFRGDYAHALGNFRAPSIPDRLLIRASVIYRHLRQKVHGTPPWAFLASATVRERALENARRLNRGENGWRFKNLDELRPFERNVRMILELANLRHMRPVLTTQPHSTDPRITNAPEATHIDQCNAIVRTLDREFAGRCIFVDIDSLMTGRMNHVFWDLGHVTDEGRRVKAEAVARAILADLAQAPSTPTTEDQGAR